jgi:Cytochrome P460
MFRPSHLSVTMRIAVVAVIAGVSYVLTVAAIPRAFAQPQAPAAVFEFTPDGKLKQPVGYRKWVYVGTPLTPKDMNDGDDSISEFHAVYIDPESFAHYEKTGEFRDGTVMVKEFVGVGSKEAVSGKGYFMGEYTGLEASIKDSKRFKDEPGNWAYFNFGVKYPLKAEAPKEAAASCNECHQDNAEVD